MLTLLRLLLLLFNLIGYDCQLSLKLGCCCVRSGKLVQRLPGALKGADETLFQVGAHPGEALLQLWNTQEALTKNLFQLQGCGVKIETLVSIIPRWSLFLPLWWGIKTGLSSKSGNIMGSIRYATGSSWNDERNIWSHSCQETDLGAIQEFETLILLLLLLCY